MKITASEAEAFFAHPTQRKGAKDGQPLPGEAEYFARNGVCLAFHWGHFPGLLMVHVGVKPEAWGRTVEPAKAILNEAWQHFAPGRVIAFVNQSNRATCKFAERIGFETDGRMAMPDPVMIYGWSP